MRVTCAGSFLPLVSSFLQRSPAKQVLPSNTCTLRKLSAPHHGTTTTLWPWQDYHEVLKGKTNTIGNSTGDGCGKDSKSNMSYAASNVITASEFMRPCHEFHFEVCCSHCPPRTSPASCIPTAMTACMYTIIEQTETSVNLGRQHRSRQVEWNSSDAGVAAKSQLFTHSSITSIQHQRCPQPPSHSQLHHPQIVDFGKRHSTI